MEEHCSAICPYPRGSKLFFQFNKALSEEEILSFRAYLTFLLRGSKSGISLGGMEVTPFCIPSSRLNNHLDRTRLTCVIHSRTPIRADQKRGGRAYTPVEAIADTFQEMYGQNAPAHKPTWHPIRWKHYPDALKT